VGTVVLFDCLNFRINSNNRFDYHIVLSIVQISIDIKSDSPNVQTRPTSFQNICEVFVQCLEHEKRTVQHKVSNLEKAIFSPSGRNPRNSARQVLLLERPIPEAVGRPKLTDPAEGYSCTSTMVRDWDFNLVQLSFPLPQLSLLWCSGGACEVK
jgi:hypothetical protein